MDTSKIIKGGVNSGRYTVTAPIVKEDYGLYLQIEGIELPSTYEVDFSNSENSGTSVTMIGNADGVLIPRQFIDTGKDIFAFLYHVGANYGRTVYKFRIPNKVRPDRTDDTPTPEEQSTIDQAISALNEAVAQTAQDVISADQSAQSAQGYAEQAETAKSDAQTYANNASASATSASQSATASANSATASAQSASQSAQIKSDVEDLVDDAQGYAQASERSASASANSASQAQGFAQSASASAQSASGYASQADISANTASNKASEASTSASTASAKATESAQSATNASQSAQTAEQAKADSQTAQGLAESARDSAVSAKTDAESAKADAESARDEAQQAVASISGALDDKAPVITDTASGSIASFSDGADDLPLKSLIVDIDPVQDLHGQDSPYPAGGGKNVLPDGELQRSSVSGVTFAWNSDGTITINGTPTNTIFNNIGTPFQLKAGTYAISKTGQSNIHMQVYNNDTNALLAQSFPENTARFTISEDTQIRVRYQVSTGATYNNAKLYPQIELGSSETSFAPYENLCPISGWDAVGVTRTGKNLLSSNFNDYLQTNAYRYILNVVPQNTLARFTFTDKDTTIDVSGCDIGFTMEAPASASLITEYRWCVNNGSIQANTSNLSMHGAICGNVFIYPNTKETFDKLFSRWNIMVELGSTATPYHPYTGRSITIDLGQTVYGGHLDVLSGVLTVDRANIASYNGETLPSTWISDRDVYASGTTPTTGAQVVYQLATPLEIQLDAHAINSLYGVNNIWADSGDSEVEYRADTKLYISKKIAEAISALS